MSKLYGVLENPECRGWSWLGAGAESQGVVFMKEVEEASLRALASGTTGNSRGNSQGKAGARLTDLRRGRRLRQCVLESQLTGGASTWSLWTGVRTSAFSLSEWGPSQLRD